jgi:hypothetical protein
MLPKVQQSTFKGDNLATQIICIAYHLYSSGSLKEYARPQLQSSLQALEE